MNVSTPVTITYVRYYLPGVVVPEECARMVSHRDPGIAAREADPSAYAFEFYDVAIATAGAGGTEVTLRSDPVDRSGRYYIDAERFSYSEVEALPGDRKMLLANMRCNGWDAVVRCRTGNWLPFRDGDVLIGADGLEAGR